jgi:hypothetical protein
LGSACRKTAGTENNKKDHAMEKNVLRIKKKTKNEMARRCYARYTDCEDQDLGKDCHGMELLSRPGPTKGCRASQED